MPVYTRKQKEADIAAKTLIGLSASSSLYNNSSDDRSESIGTTDSDTDIEEEEEDNSWITDGEEDLEESDLVESDQDNNNSGSVEPPPPLRKIPPITKHQVNKVISFLSRRKVLDRKRKVVVPDSSDDSSDSEKDSDAKSKTSSESDDEPIHPMREVVEDTIESLMDDPYAGELKITEEFLSLSTNDEICKAVDSVKELQTIIQSTQPSLLKIINSNLMEKDKAYMVERFLIYLNKEESSDERISEKMYINNYIKSKEIKDPEVFQQVMKREKEAEDRFNRRVNLKERLYALNTTEQNMDIIFKMYREYEESQGDDNEEKGRRDWLDQVSMIPFGKYDSIPIDNFSSMGEYLVSVRNNLDEHISFMEDIKDELLAMIATIASNRNANIRVIALEGPAGVGKTRLAMKGIAESLGRKFYSISVGTMTDGASIGGDRRVYLGSSPGKILQILTDAQCMNPVILIDELDKVDTTHGGRGIYNALTHLLDPTQSSQFKDSYFNGLTFDLSKILFVISYNDVSRIDHIVGDRIQKFIIPKRTTQEKLIIMQRHLVKEILANTGFTESDIVFGDNVCKRVIELSKIKEDGCRQLYRNIETIVSRLNILRVSETNCKNLCLSYKLSDNEMDTLYTLPIVVTESMVNALFWEPRVNGAAPEGMYM
jgi:ATP-dependent Lon protease